MESFEHLCKVAPEAERFVVTGNVKFFVRRKTQKKAHAEYQEHGYEIDLVAARGDQLVLAEVKSYFWLRGASTARDFANWQMRPAALTMTDLSCLTTLNCGQRSAPWPASDTDMNRIGSIAEVRWQLARGHEQAVREHLANLRPIPVQVVGLGEIVPAIIGLAGKRTYTDDPVVMTVKALAAAGRLTGATSKVTL